MPRAWPSALILHASLGPLVPANCCPLPADQPLLLEGLVVCKLQALDIAESGSCVAESGAAWQRLPYLAVLVECHEGRC